MGKRGERKGERGRGEGKRGTRERKSETGRVGKIVKWMTDRNRGRQSERGRMREME